MQFWAHIRKAHERARSIRTDLLNSKKNDKDKMTRDRMLDAKCVMRMEPKDVSRPCLQTGIPNCYYTVDDIEQTTIHNVLRKLL